MKPPFSLSPKDPRLISAVAVGLTSLVTFVIVRVTGHAPTSAEASVAAGAAATVAPGIVAWLFSHFSWKLLPPGAKMVISPVPTPTPTATPIDIGARPVPGAPVPASTATPVSPPTTPSSATTPGAQP